MNKTVNLGRSVELDQYYTNPEYAIFFFDKIKELIDLTNYDLMLEPSAGSGSFFNLFDKNKRMGLDLDPKKDNILKIDFFDWIPPNGKNIITIGNPPFGKNSSLAVKFFNYAATFSHVIAFILPRTFRKESIINRLNDDFHLIYDSTVPNNSFLIDGKPYNVSCCSQIWIKKDFKRLKIKPHKLSDLDDWFSLTDPNNSDFAIQRVGANAGSIKECNRLDYSPSSHYFIKTKHPDVLPIFKSINYDDVKFNTAGNPSISPSELARLWIIHAAKLGIII